MEATFTFNECYEMLNVDPKTFRGWLEEAGIDPKHQVSRADRRVRFLTKSQVEKLAEAHGRLLRKSSAPDEPISLGAFKLLVDRVTRAEEALARQPHLLEEVGQQFTAQLTARDEQQAESVSKLDARIAGLEGAQQEIIMQQQKLLSALEDMRQAQAQQIAQINEGLAGQQRESQQIRSRIYEQIETAAHQLTAIEQAHRELAERNQQEHVALLDDWKQTREALDTQNMLLEEHQFETSQHFTTVMNVSKQQYQQIEELANQVTQLNQDVVHINARINELPAAAPPTHTMHLAHFADLHSVSREEAAKKWKAGFISGKKEVPSGRTSSRLVPIVIDGQGQHDFWVQFHEVPDFRSCDDCPHTPQAQKEAKIATQEKSHLSAK
jgi:hypothetical protein